MTFEIRERDLLGRIGRLETKSGTIETPQLMPVINPNVQPVSPRTLREEFDCTIIMTNAYIVRKHFGETAVKEGIHRFLEFDGVVATDSGAYQILVYGDVNISPKEIVQYQEEIGSDVATILDVPTGWRVSKRYAQHTVDETLRRARELKDVKSRDDVAWIGPIQGGRYLDLVARSAREMGNLPFQIHALGSPTPVMERYLFDVLVDMIMTAKMNLPPERPLHLFGAGHPFMFALATSLGCDLFDSAAYAIYSRDDRYMTEYGTTKLGQLEYFPCSCQVCVKNDPQSVAEMPKAERQETIARHNLYASLSEMRRIKQAITEGRLWEHLEMRAHGHPSLLQALKNTRKYTEYLERHSPITKKSGVFFFSHLGLFRPEVVRHRKRLFERYSPPEGKKVLILLPQTQTKPFNKSKEHRRIQKEIQETLGEKIREIHFCTYAAPFGVVPTELDEVYPLTQHETTSHPDAETIEYTAKQIANYVTSKSYNQVFLLQDVEAWKGKITARCRQACRKKGIPLLTLPAENLWDKSTLNNMLREIKRV